MKRGLRKPSGEEAYDWWRQALRAIQRNAPIPDLRELEPHAGLYEMRHRGAMAAVHVFWWSDTDAHGELVCDEVLMALRGTEYVDPYQQWTWMRPITRERFERYERGLIGALPESFVQPTRRIEA